MIYYNANRNEIDKTKVIQSVVFKVTNALASTAIQGYDLTCTGFDVPNMTISFEITHIGYPVEILFYNGTVFKRSKEFKVDYKSVLDIIKDQTLTPQQREDAVDKQIETINGSIAGMLYDQIKTHQVLKGFEKIVYDKYVVPKNFPSPEKMVEEFKVYYDAVKSIPSPIPFPCTIADWWVKLEEIIKKNTAFWKYAITHDEAYRVNYGLALKDFFRPNYFTVYDDMFDICCWELDEDHESAKNRVEIISNAHINELNGVPLVIQNGVPMSQPQHTAV